MMKFCRKLTALVLFSTLFTVVSTQTSNAGIETLKYCAVDFNRDIPLTETAFTYEIKYALGYDEELASFTSAGNPQFPNAAGGVVTSDHSTLLGSRDAPNAGLEIYYNTNYLNGQLLFYMGKPGGWHWFKNPSWKFPEFTRAQGSSSYIHIAVVRDAQRRLALYFNGVPATQSGSTIIQGAVTYNDVSYQVDNNDYSSVRYFGTSGSYINDVNPKAFVSNLRLVTGAALYSATAASISIPSTAALKLNADTGTTQVILNSRTPEGLLTNESNYDATAASLYNFGGDQTAINNQIAVGAACTPTPEDAYIGGDGVYNVYYKEGNVLKDSGTAPKKRDFYFSENVNPTPITIPTRGDMVKAGNTFIGWNTRPDGYGTTYRAGTSYRPTDNTTLYTKWSTSKSVTYNLSGATGDLPSESNKLWEDTFTVAPYNATNGSYKFNGWQDSLGNLYAPGEIYTVANSNVTLTAFHQMDTTISNADVTLTAPVAGAVPVSSITSNAQYDTAITWNDSPATFAYNTIYTATITVSPKTGYTVAGVSGNFFTVNGNSATTPNSRTTPASATSVFTYQFPRTALGPAETPSFDTPTATADGFSVTITNYDSAYTWDTPTVSSGSVAITSTSTPNRVLTVTGLSPGASATITQTTSRVNYASGSNTVTGTTLPPLNPTFGSVTRTVGGFSVPITNYDSAYTWDTPTVSSGSVAVTSTSGAIRVLTVTGLSAGETATITQGTSRTNYPNGTNSVTGTAQVPLNPTFGSVTRTATGFTVSITNYDADYTWDTPTVTTGTVAITSTDGANRLLTVTGLSASGSATITQATSRSNYPNGTNTVAGTALNAAYNPTFDTPTATGVGFSVSITNYDASYTWDTPTVTSGSVAVTSTSGAIRVLTVTGLSPGDTATITQTTSRSTYAPGSNTVTSRTLLVINEANVAITAPITGATPVSSLVSNGQYTTAITWSDTPTTFAPNTFYTATVTVTPDSGYMLSGVGANFFTVNGNSATSGNLANAGVFTYRFPETAIIVTTANISITAPATGATPVSSLSSNGQYTTAITWSDSPSRFAATTTYTATVTVTPNAGYTLTGVAANLFTVNGDTATGTGSYSKTTLNSGGTPYGIAVDSAGNVYTPNIGSNTVTKTTPQGVSSTLGTTGEVRELQYVPMGIAVDSLGNVYVSNVVSSTVTKITPQGVSTTFGTTGASPVGIAIDSLGNVYTADAESSTVTKITPQGVSTTLGTTASTPVGIAVDSSGNVYTSHLNSDSDSFTVTKITPQGVSTTLGTTDGAALSIAVDSSGNVYTANYTVGTITKITPQGVSTTFGTTVSTPVGIAVDSLGNVYVTNVEVGSDTGTVTKITPQGVSTTLGTTGALPIAIAVDNSGNLYTANTISGNVTKFTASGTNAANAGTFTYLFAATGAKLAQAITFAQPAAMSKASSNQALVASSSATGSYPITFTSTTTAVCTVVAGAIRAISAGTCSITASQAGDGIYLAAASVIKSIAITSNKLLQTINFTQPVAMNKASSNQTLVATSSAGISYPITFTSTTTGICTVVAGAIDVLATGTCSITASQAGDGTYNPATSVTRSITVSKIPQIITFNQPAAMTRTSSDQPLVASSNAGDTYTVNFASTTTNVCTVLSRAIHIVAPGTCSITASQAGDSDYATASAVRSIVIGKLTQTITFTTPVAMTLISGNQTLVASSSATGSYPITFTSTTTRVCKIINGNTLQAVSAGTCSITASQRGDATYLPANNVIKSFVLRSGR